MTKTHFLHPGEIVKIDYLEEHGLTIAEASSAMGMTRARLNEIIRGKRSISADTALRLARFFGGEAVFWLNLQAHYDLAKVETATRKQLTKIRPIQTVATAH